MDGQTAYLDTSAFLKLLVAEPESQALRTRLARWPGRASASLLRTETVRALRRAGLAQLVGASRQLMSGLTLIDLDQRLLDRAAGLGPPSLRSLDAVHLAAALELGSDLGAIMTYDARLAEAARAQGVVVEAPGMTG